AEVSADRGTAVRIDGHAYELERRPPALHCRTHLGQHVVEGPRDFASARGWHDAECAVLIAAFDDCDQGLGRRRPVDVEEVVATIFREISGHSCLAGEHFVKVSDVSRPHHEVDPRCAFEDGLPFLLRYASANTDLHVVATLQLAQRSKSGKHLVLGLVADRAGVQENEIRLALVVHTPVPAQLQAAGEALAVEIIHLTAPGLDEEGPVHCLDLVWTSRASASSLRASSSCRLV